MHSCIDQGPGSVVRESEFKSEDPGFDPLAGQVKGQFFCAHFKDPISICGKRLGLIAVGMETRKHCTQEIV